MINVENNRGVSSVQDLYSALLKDKMLALVGRKDVDNRHCVLVTTTTVPLTTHLNVPGKATLAIDEQNGFPVCVTVVNGESRTVVTYSNPQVNVGYSAALFTPPSTVKFDTVRGQEHLLLGQGHGNVAELTNSVPHKR